MTYTGFYINLDRSTDRRAAMEAEFARCDLRDCYRRFPACEGNALGFQGSLTDNEMGCFTSHYLVCRDNLDCPTHLHIVEDDAMFSRFTSQAIRTGILTTFIDKFDILFLDGIIDPFWEGLPLQEYKQLYDRCISRDELGNVTNVNFRPIRYAATSTSYLVNRRSINKLLSVFDRTLANGIRDPIDIILRKKGQAGALRIGCLFPFLTSIRLDGMMTTITGRQNDALSILAMNLLRHSFFIDCDICALLEYAEKALPPLTTEPHYRLLGRLLTFISSAKV
jgi:GR25 family glycosyltransferase involved in LPS biosynthesis